MATSGKQTEKGKAFEYACVYAITEKYGEKVNVHIEDSPQMDTAKRCFAYLKEMEKSDYIKGARAAIKIIERLEPMLNSNRGNLVLSIQQDKKGGSGDVRDVICARGTDWEIGLSCKHNHEAVKHSRLSDLIDFGKEWFGKPCSPTYFEQVRKVFVPLRKMKEESKDNPILWKDLPDKERDCYLPVLDAFMQELRRLDSEFPKQIPPALVQYLIGRNDFYKVIMNDKRKYTVIESMNVNGNLNKPDGKRKALIDVPIMKLPTKFYEIGYKDNSNNTIYVVCDNGWNISMRIHNADSKVEPSLKFDVQLLAMPSSILTQIEPWD